MHFIVFGKFVKITSLCALSWSLLEITLSHESTSCLLKTVKIVQSGFTDCKLFRKLVVAKRSTRFVQP